MAHIQYIVSKRFHAKTMAKIDFANEIMEDLTSRGYTPTLRQIYYRFVAAGKIRNTQREYKNLGSTLSDGRLCGYIDWDHMVDRTRSIRGASHWEDPSSIIDSVVWSYGIDKWQGQDYYVEVWVEKDAQINVVSKACGPLDIRYFSCRGYVSQSEMHVAAGRLRSIERQGRSPVILHLGDHDPSGLDMTRDIKERLTMFGADVEIRRIGLNIDQVRDQRLPPNPAKLTDCRCEKYIEEFGRESWELDALDPDYINDLITEEVDGLRDHYLFDERYSLQEKQRKQLEYVRDNWDSIISEIDE